MFIASDWVAPIEGKLILTAEHIEVLLITLCDWLFDSLVSICKLSDLIELPDYK